MVGLRRGAALVVLLHGDTIVWETARQCLSGTSFGRRLGGAGRRPGPGVGSCCHAERAGSHPQRGGGLLERRLRIEMRCMSPSSRHEMG